MSHQLAAGVADSSRMSTFGGLSSWFSPAMSAPAADMDRDAQKVLVGAGLEVFLEVS